MFKRDHHRQIAQVLSVMDGQYLRDLCCWFGGGTAMALRYGEYRESVDIDFLVSDRNSYRTLRQELTGPDGVLALMPSEQAIVRQLRDVRADQYGIRTMLAVDQQPIKFEIVLEGRIRFDLPSASDALAGIATLTRADMVAAKLLANNDRWADDGIFNRDLLDIAMSRPSRETFRITQGCGLGPSAKAATYRG